MRASMRGCSLLGTYKKLLFGMLQGVLHKEERIYFHRYLTRCPKNMTVDHINGDTLDNRLSNLRVCTQKQNNANKGKLNPKATSKFLGVCICNYYVKTGRGKKWSAFLDNKMIGTFSIEEEAAIYRDKLAYERHGEFARLNFPLS